MKAKSELSRSKVKLTRLTWGTKFLSAGELAQKLAVLNIELQFECCVHRQPV